MNSLNVKDEIIVNGKKIVAAYSIKADDSFMQPGKMSEQEQRRILLRQVTEQLYWEAKGVKFYLRYGSDNAVVKTQNLKIDLPSLRQFQHYVKKNTSVYIASIERIDAIYVDWERE